MSEQKTAFFFGDLFLCPQHSDPAVFEGDPRQLRVRIVLDADRCQRRLQRDHFKIQVSLQHGKQLSVGSGARIGAAAGC